MGLTHLLSLMEYMIQLLSNYITSFLTTSLRVGFSLLCASIVGLVSSSKRILCVQIVGLNPFRSLIEYPITPLCLFKTSHKAFTSLLGSKELTIKGKIELESRIRERFKL